MLSFLTQGNKYKKKFTVQFDSSDFILKLFSQKSDSYIIDYHDGSYQNITTNQNGYLQITKHDFFSKKISIAYDNYNINGLYFANNNAKKIILQQLRHLKYLNVSQNNLQYAVLKNCQSLTNLIISNNQLIQLDLTNNKMLQYVDISGNNIQCLNLNYNKKLVKLSANNNLLENINIPFNVQFLNLSFNKLKNVTFDKRSQLKYLNLSNNLQLKNIVINSSVLQKIWCKNTMLTRESIVFEDKSINPQIVF